MSYRPHQATIAAFALGPLSVLTLACAAHRGSIMKALVAHEAVCLQLDWGTPFPNYFGPPFPDTVFLLPSAQGASEKPRSTNVAGSIELAPSAAHQPGLGWNWYTTGDTLWITTMTPPMDDIWVRVPQPDRTQAGEWGFTSHGGRGGEVGVRSHPCPPSIPSAA
jgi:hypothetical protein